MKLYILDIETFKSWADAEEKEISRFDPVDIWDAVRKTKMFEEMIKYGLFQKKIEFEFLISKNKNGANNMRIIFDLELVPKFNITWPKGLCE